MTDAQKAALAEVKEIHEEATRYLHTRELSETAMIARIAYLMGELKAPIKVLSEADEAS